MKKCTMVCKKCGYAISRGDAYFQRQRVIEKGLSPDEAKKMMPMCSKCVTKHFREEAEQHARGNTQQA